MLPGEVVLEMTGLKADVDVDVRCRIRFRTVIEGKALTLPCRTFRLRTFTLG
jgi:hypothetical protein